VDIQEKRVVTISYIMSNEADGEMLEIRSAEDPVTYLHGAGELPDGLERALIGKKRHDEVAVTVPPEDAYGDHEPEAVVNVDISYFDEPPEVGDEIIAELDTGEVGMTVISVNGDDVIMDGNHPMAGKTLRFHVCVLDVRPATGEELAHGHAHADGQCDG